MITARLSPRPARSIASASPSISAVEHGVPASRTAGPVAALGPQPFRSQREHHDRVGPHEHVALRPDPDAAHLTHRRPRGARLICSASPAAVAAVSPSARRASDSR